MVMEQVWGCEWWVMEIMYLLLCGQVALIFCIDHHYTISLKYCYMLDLFVVRRVCSAIDSCQRIHSINTFERKWICSHVAGALLNYAYASDKQGASFTIRVFHHRQITRTYTHTHTHTHARARTDFAKTVTYLLCFALSFKMSCPRRRVAVPLRSCICS